MQEVANQNGDQSQRQGKVGPDNITDITGHRAFRQRCLRYLAEILVINNPEH